jgi:2-phosphosulfolactate phosphatase
MTYDQSEFDIRCEWGEQGVARLAPLSDVVVIVDILSFSTSVDIATGRGAIVYPFRQRGEPAAQFAASIGAELAGIDRNRTGYTLSPESLLNIPAGTRLVLPSPNGSTLTTQTGTTPTLAGCLRNCRAVALAAQRYGRRIAVIPAGERWKDDGSLRPCFEDWVGAGAIISHLNGSLSPEAQAAVAAFQHLQPELRQWIRQCSSGKELIERGFAADVELAVEFNASECVPVVRDSAYVRMEV